MSIRRGVIAARSVSAAMDILDAMTTAWKRVIVKVDMHEMNEHGELLLQTVNQDSGKKKVTEVTPLSAYSSVFTAPNFATLVVQETKS
jgi:hypothetical protein